jgi:cyclic beta-1,2-glucan synthetase
MFHALNPINHTRRAEEVERYKAEPYVVAGDVYARSPHAGRAGWSWYTGSAAWMYRVGVESLLGLRRSGDSFTIDPCIPASWPGFEMRWHVRGTEYRISVENPSGQCRGVARIVVDGVVAHTRTIRLIDNAGTCEVRVILGTPEGQA